MPWQAQVADVALEVGADGRLVYRDVTLTVPRQQGKSFLVLVLMLTRGLLSPRQGVAYAAQSALDARKKLIDDWTPMVRSSVVGSQVTVFLAPGREALTLANGSQVALIASTAKAGHGRVLDLAIMDEAFAYADARTEQALRPAMMTRPDPQLWVVSTAGTPEASPYLLDRVERGRQAVEAGVTSGLCFFEWSAGDEQAIDDPETWRSCMPALGYTVSEEAVRSAVTSMPRREFERAYLNRWTTTVGDPIVSLATWTALAVPDAPRPASLILGVDIAPRSKSGSIAVAGIDDGRLIVSILEHGPGTAWVADKLGALQAQLRAEVVVDPKACAAIMPEIDDLKLVGVDHNELAAGCAFFIDLIERGKLAHRGEHELTAALDGAAMRPLGDQWAWSRKSSGVDITPLVAATLACWGWRWDSHWSGE